MDVVERQHVQDTVVGSPAPGVDEGRDLGLDVGVGRHDSLGPPGRSARVEDHRSPVDSDIRQGLFDDRSLEQLRSEDEPQPPSLGDRPKRLGELGMRHDYGCIGVVDRVFELGLGVRHGERDRYAARTPDAPLHGNVLEAGGREKGDPRLGKIGSAGEQHGRGAGRGFQEGAVRVFPRVVDNGGAVAMDRCASE